MSSLYIFPTKRKEKKYSDKDYWPNDNNPKEHSLANEIKNIFSHNSNEDKNSEMQLAFFTQRLQKVN